MSSPVIVDTRGMEQPAPVLTILKAVTTVGPEGWLEALLDNYPFQLYDLLQQRGFQGEFEKQADGKYKLTARRRVKSVG